VSRRKKTAPAPSPRDAAREPAPPDHAEEPAGIPARRILIDVVLLAAVFGAGVGIAELAGAANLGVSFGIGQIAFAIALTVLLTRG
jgi:hypothetical protein